MRRWFFWIAFFSLLPVLLAAPEPDQAKTRVADGFDQPVGKPDAEGYYTSRGFHAYHPGEDWNGIKGGNSDLGAPVYAIGTGYVTFAHDARMGWGNVVLIRHIFLENGKLQTIDSMYAHLDKILVREGQQVARGQQVGTIGTNHGMYVAHLHFEIRKNLNVGINRSAFKCDFTNYYRPGEFIASHRKLPGGDRTESIVINTYTLGKLGAAHQEDATPRKSFPEKKPALKPAPGRKSSFRVNRFEDL
jgi:murein DD-endopeptidase MepM/ murein hydrolase activator NlpD